MATNAEQGKEMGIYIFHIAERIFILQQATDIWRSRNFSLPLLIN